MGAFRGQWVMGDHEHCLAMVLNEAAEQVEDLIRTFAVEVAGGLVAEQERGSATIARAIPTRCSCPPESCRG